MADERNDPLYRLLYVSTARHRLSEQELEQLLVQARDANRAKGITGMLVYAEGYFIQYVEGPQSEVLALIRRIERDRRHHGVIRLYEGPEKQRVFSRWSMGFRAVQRDEHEAIDGLVNLVQRPLFSALPANIPRDLAMFMESFYRNSLGRGGSMISV